ncbi:MAG TPA: helix-turn-helix transcriptional regulator [Polyangiaceae bacterium]
MSDCWCEVSRAKGQRGVVRSLRFLDPCRDAAPFVGRPLGALLAELGARAAVRSLGALLEAKGGDAVVVEEAGAEGAFLVVTSRAAPAGAVHVTVRHLEKHLLPLLLDAQIARAGRRSDLSAREGEVLRLLLHGRSLEDAAVLLGIAPRTVKFHQSNILRKLDAESRFDLLRVVFP